MGVHIHSSTMVSSSINCKILPAMILLFFLYTSSSASIVFSSKPDNFQQSNQTFRLGKELHKLKMIRAYLIMINKPSVKTIQACISWLKHCKSSEFFFSHFYSPFYVNAESRWWFDRLCSISSATSFWSPSFGRATSIGTYRENCTDKFIYGSVISNNNKVLCLWIIDL